MVIESSVKGLTEVREIMRGFVGTRGISKEPCKNGRKRIRFGLAAGDTDMQKLIYPIWRRCCGYDDIADQLNDLMPKEYLKVEGYLVNEIMRDYSGKPVFMITGQPVCDPTLIIQSVVRMNHNGRQYRMFEGWQSGASDMVETLC